MPIQFACSSCRAKIQVPTSAAGKQARCPNCSSVVKVPAVSQPPRKPAGAGKPPAAAPPPGVKMAIRCPGCSRTLHVPKASAGKTLSCPKCTTKFRVPGAGAAAPAGPSAGSEFDFSSSPASSDPFAGIEPSELSSAPLGPSPLSQVPSSAPAGGAYRPPSSYSSRLRSGREPWQYVVPGVIIATLSGLVVAGSIFSLVAFAMIVPRLLDLPPEAMGQAIGQAVAAVVLLFLHGFAIYGAIAMIRRDDLSAAKTAAVIACLPCGACCIGHLPFGIWAASMVFSREAERDFR